MRNTIIRNYPLQSGSSANGQRAGERAIRSLFRIDPAGKFFAPRVGGVRAGQVAGNGGTKCSIDSLIAGQIQLL